MSETRKGKHAGNGAGELPSSIGRGHGMTLKEMSRRLSGYLRRKDGAEDGKGIGSCKLTSWLRKAKAKDRAGRAKGKGKK